MQVKEHTKAKGKVGEIISKASFTWVPSYSSSPPYTDKLVKTTKSMSWFPGHP